ncbi:MAG: peptidoglycan-binding protein [Candidatus Omnitrophica bacterium]|nr:peptidoglycan-binding protein [Candidatus Omnitrophota bacterium]MBU4467188.1 peptidoglycan-binding protein [Candidatus Omnitrophota bacterium]
MKRIIVVLIIALFLVPFFSHSFTYFKKVIDDRRKIIFDKRQVTKDIPDEQKAPEILVDSEEDSNFQETIETPAPLSIERSNKVVINQVKENKVKPQEKFNIQDKVLSYPLKSKDNVTKIQNALKLSGFYKGKIDGKLGSQTKKAIKAFQKSKKLRPDGIVGKKTWEALEKYLKN